MQLSKDLILEIMYRLPGISLGRCALVCRTLNTIISDPQFPRAHLEFSKKHKEPLTLALKASKIMSTLEFNDCKDITKGVRLVDLRHQFPAREYAFYSCTLLGSCDGVVCIYLKSKLNLKMSYYINDDLVFIWNPVTNERKEIDLPDEVRKNFSVLSYAFWFGYVASRDEYKIVLIYYGTRIFICSFTTSSWRLIPAGTNNASVLFSFGFYPVFTGEALYHLFWGKCVGKFNLVDETFEMMMPIDIGDVPDSSNAIMSLGLIGREDDCLRVVYVKSSVNVRNERENPEEEEEQTLEVWMLKEFGNLNSLERQRRIGLPRDILRKFSTFLGLTYSGILCFQGKHGLRFIDLIDDPPSYAIASTYNVDQADKLTDYVESLISPFDL